MSTKIFCESCQVLFDKKIINNEIRLICNCEKSDKNKPDASDTLMFSRTLKVKNTSDMDNSKYYTFMKTAGKDVTNPKIEKECKEKGCKSKYHRYVRLGEEQKTYYICEVCNHILS